MDIAGFCLRNRTTTLVFSVVLLLAGIQSFQTMSRLEDPEFTIKDALVITPYPGASAEEVEEEVTDELEIAIQQLGELDELESRSMRGSSIIRVTIQDKYDAQTLPQVWDKLRRKVSDAQGLLPPGAGTSQVYDDYGDVYGIYITLYGSEFSYAELKDIADDLRLELLKVDDVAKIDVQGYRTEAIIVEPRREIMARLGLSPGEILNQLYQRNLVRDTGRVKIGTEFIAIDPTGGINSVEDIQELRFSYGDRQFRLRDVADIYRSYVDPANDAVYFNGQPAIALGVSTVTGGNAVRMGDALDKRIEELRPYLPLGLEIGVVSHQASTVKVAISGFLNSLLQALGVVIVVLLLFMGWRSGLLISIILLLTIFGSFAFLKPMGVALERISLGALIIALGMLVDNAIVIVDGMLAGMKRGKSAEQAAIDIVKQSAIPLLGATAIAIFAFAAIGTTQNTAGEFCRSLFTVLAVSLSLSWVTAVTVTPLLGAVLLKPPPTSKQTGNLHDNVFYRFYRVCLHWAIRLRWLTVLLVLSLFGTAIWGFGYVKNAFFPPSTRAQFMVDVWLPQGSHLEETRASVVELEDWLQQQEGIGNITSLIGEGALRFLLTYDPELPNPSYGQLLVDVEDARQIPAYIKAIEAHASENYPDMLVYGFKFELGPGGKGKVQARFTGPDPEVLRGLSEEASAIVKAHSNTKGVRTDWRQKVKLLRPQLAEERANLLGIGKEELSVAIRQAFEGVTVGLYREDDLLLPVIVRATDDQRTEVSQIDNIQIWSPVARKRVPLTQVISGVDLVFEDDIIMRLDRERAITVFADATEGTAAALHAQLRPQIEQIPLPDGYELLWYGEYKDSADANRALAAGIPLFLLLMVLTTVMLFNSLRQPLAIWLCVPLSLIGVSIGLLVTGQPFSFMALLGFLSLSGMLIKNAIVMIDELNVQLAAGKEAYLAILDAATARLLPIAMAASTTALGMLPLLFDDFFAAMAVTIIFGLIVATVLTTLVLPVFYAILYRVRVTQSHKGD